MTLARVKNAVDTWVDLSKPTRNYGNKQKMWLASAAKRGYIYFNKPWPNGVTIISAVLKLYNVEAWAGSVTLEVRRADAKWGVNNLTWNNQPGLVGSTASLTRSGANANSEWAIDITAIAQAVANGGPWYGLRIATDRVADGSVWSTQAPTGSYRPVLEVTWSSPPSKPDGLRPAGGRAVSIAKPLVAFNYNDPSGDDSLTAIQVQIDTTEVMVAPLLFDSGEVATSEPELDLNTTLFAGLAEGESAWWRVRAKDDTGLWSVWSDSAQWSRFAKGTVTITSPTTNLTDVSPAVTWTVGGVGIVQRAYQVLLIDEARKTVLWDSGKITSTATSVGIPSTAFNKKAIQFGVTQFRIVVRMYDTLPREAVPGSPVYAEANWVGSIALDATAHGITSLSAISDPIKPVEHLTWTRAAGAPTSWVVLRSKDDGTNWYVSEDETGAALSTGGTGYAFDEILASPYTPFRWMVIPVFSGVMRDGPTVTGQIRRLAPFLMRKDQTDLVCFLNAQKTRTRSDIQALHQTLGSNPVLVTQRLGGRTGRIGGRFASDVLSGVTADMMRDRFENMREDSGVTLVLYNVNETFLVNAYNMNIEPIPDGDGITYFAEFDWVEVDE